MKAVYKLLIFTTLLLVTLVVSITANLNNNRNSYDITINYPEQIYFNKQLYVENLIQEEYYKSLLKDDLYNTIEESISNTPGIQKAEIYKLYNGTIIIDLYDTFPPSAQISADKLTINCLDNTVYFVDHSAMKKEEANWEWSFPGGTPSSSTLQNPIVTYEVKAIHI